MRVVLQVAVGRDAPEAVAIEALDRRAARAEALRRGYTILDDATAGFVLRLRPHQNPLDASIFVEQLKDLLSAGLGVVEALTTLRRGATGEAVDAIAAMERRLHEGAPLSQALDESLAFPPLLVALVRTSELTSDLPATLGRYLDHERRVAEVRHRVASSAIYPALLLAVGGAVLLFLFFYVMPRFARVFEGMSGKLPMAAEWMVAWSDWLRGMGPIGTVVLVILTCGIALALATPAVRRATAARVLDWKPLRSGLRTYFLARWYRATGLLIEGGSRWRQHWESPGGCCRRRSGHKGMPSKRPFVRACLRPRRTPAQRWRRRCQSN
jgi:general secretion pathway protein F